MQNLHFLTHSVESVLRPDTVLGALVYLVLACIFASVLSHALRIAIQTATSHAPADRVDRTAANFLRQLGVLIIWVFVLALYARLIPALRALGTAMLTGASIASVVLGLAAQNTLGNLIAGIALLIYRPFRVGDLLQVSSPAGPEVGTVESLSLGYTALRTEDGRRIVVPNSVAASQVTINLNAFAAGGARTIHFWVARADLIPARRLAIEFGESAGASTAGCYVVKSDSSSVQLALVMRPAAAAHGPSEPEAQMLQRFVDMLAHNAVATPQGKEAPGIS